MGEEEKNIEVLLWKLFGKVIVLLMFMYIATSFSPGSFRRRLPRAVDFWRHKHQTRKIDRNS